jgi:hypothetical protein
MADYRKTGAKYEDFLDANGKFDNDKWQTADMSAADYERIMNERGFTRASKGESGNGSQFVDRKRPVVRVEALLKNAPVAKDVRSLGGTGGAQPVSEDAQAEALRVMMGKKSSTLNSSGVDVGDLQPKNVPPRPTPNDLEGTIRNPDGSFLKPEQYDSPSFQSALTKWNLVEDGKFMCGGSVYLWDMTLLMDAYLHGAKDAEDLMIWRTKLEFELGNSVHEYINTVSGKPYRPNYGWNAGVYGLWSEIMKQGKASNRFFDEIDKLK